MPRSPSPPYRPRGGYDSRRDNRDRDTYGYRDRDSEYARDDRDYPPTYRGRGSGRGRGRGRGRGGYRERDDRDRRRSYSRSLSRSRSRSRDRARDRRPLDTRDRVDRERRFSPTKSRSVTPEEGQITSSVPSSRRRSPLPPPPRRTSPPAWRRERDRDRERDRSMDRDRDRDRDWRDDRRRPTYSRSSRSPLPPARHDRDYSPASASSRSLSTRFPSPEKRRVGYSPRPRSPDRDQSSRVSATPDRPTEAPKRPIPVAVPLHAQRMPPSGPRSERFPFSSPVIPSGPRALQNPHHQHQASAPAPTPAQVINPYTPRASTSGSVAGNPESVPATPNRLSWADRKTSGFGPGPGTESGFGQGASQVEEDIKPKIEQPETASPALDEAAQEEQRVREEEARITAELPELKIPFGRARWELELDNHYKRMLVLQHNTDRARSMQRIAGAVLADAEAELYGAMERSKVVEDQLVKASSLGVGVGLL